MKNLVNRVHKILENKGFVKIHVMSTSNTVANYLNKRSKIQKDLNITYTQNGMMLVINTKFRFEPAAANVVYN